MKKALIVIGGLALAIIGFSYFFTVSNVATAPSRVVNDTVKTENIIGNYEAFFDLKAGYETRVAQIADLKAEVEAASGSDKRYARVDLNGARQSCRTTAQKYNADAKKLNRGVFKSNDLPETLDATKCEG